MTAPANPQASTLPGIQNLTPSISWHTGTDGSVSFTDSKVKSRKIEFRFGSDNHWEGLTLRVDDGTICSFEKCDVPNQNLWYASGLIVQETGCGIASHLYASVRDLLKSRNAQITPSGNITDQGAAFWDKLDPTLRSQFTPSPAILGHFIF
jgi:hypothetical protein